MKASEILDYLEKSGKDEIVLFPNGVKTYFSHHQGCLRVETRGYCSTDSTLILPYMDLMLFDEKAFLVYLNDTRVNDIIDEVVREGN